MGVCCVSAPLLCPGLFTYPFAESIWGPAALQNVVLFDLCINQWRAAPLVPHPRLPLHPKCNRTAENDDRYAQRATQGHPDRLSAAVLVVRLRKRRAGAVQVVPLQRAAALLSFHSSARVVSALDSLTTASGPS